MSTRHPWPISALSLCACLALSHTTPAQLSISDTGTVPEVAYNESAGLYLVTWQAFWVKGDAVFGRFLDSTGSFVGRPYRISPYGGFYAYAEHARAAPMAGSDYDFAAVTLGGYAGRYPLFAGVSPTNRSSAVPIAGLGDTYYSVCVGGEATTVDDDAVVVGTNRTQGAIQAFEVDVNTQTVTNQVNLATTGVLWEVAIATTGGTSGRYLVVWRQGNDLRGAIVDRDVNVLVSAFPVAQTSAIELEAEVDGDGTNWVVAYERQRANGDSDVMCRGVTFDSRSNSVLVTDPVPIAADPNVSENDPSVRWTGESYVVGYRRGAGQNVDLYVKSVEFLGCQPCEGVSPIATSSAAEQNLRMAAGPGRDGGLIAWDRDDQIFGLLFTTDDGDVVDLGGGCGQGGTARATCAAVGAPAFGMSAQHAAPSTSGWLVLGANQINFACGPCTLVPDPAAVLPVTTDARGNAEVSFQLGSNPALRGRFFSAQWLFVAPGGCSSLGLSLSNAIQVTIE